MKRLLVVLLVLSPALGFSQKIGTLYAGPTLFDFKNVGISAAYNFNLLKIIGLGAGVDVSSYEKESIIPVYVDLKLSKRFGKVQPFLNGQAGKVFYEKELLNMRTGQKVTGKGENYFAAGAGVNYWFSKVGIFAHFRQSFLKFKDTEYAIDPSTGPAIEYFEGSPSISVLSVGIVF